jgi:hypothetical protein
VSATLGGCRNATQRRSGRVSRPRPDRCVLQSSSRALIVVEWRRVLAELGKLGVATMSTVAGLVHQLESKLSTTELERVA